MRKQDRMILVVVALFSAIVSFVLSSLIISTDESKSVSVEVVSPIKGELLRPDEKYFNSNAINPTRDTTPTQEPNNNPFGSQ
jgi:hypothetical protein